MLKINGPADLPKQLEEIKTKAEAEGKPLQPVSANQTGALTDALEKGQFFSETRAFLKGEQAAIDTDALAEALGEKLAYFLDHPKEGMAALEKAGIEIQGLPKGSEHMLAGAAMMKLGELAPGLEPGEAITALAKEVLPLLQAQFDAMRPQLAAKLEGALPQLQEALGSGGDEALRAKVMMAQLGFELDDEQAVALAPTAAKGLQATLGTMEDFVKLAGSGVPVDATALVGALVKDVLDAVGKVEALKTQFGE